MVRNRIVNISQDASATQMIAQAVSMCRASDVKVRD